MATKQTTKKPAPGKAQNRTRGATSAQAIAAMKRKDDAIEKRLEGKSYAQIGEELGISRQAAHQLVMSAIDEEREQRAEKVEQLIAVSNMRLGKLMATYFTVAQGGDLAAFGAVMKLEERFAKLNGLDAASRTEITGANGAPLATGVFAVPFTAPSVADWTAQALAQSSDEEAKAEALLGGANGTNPPAKE